MYTVGKKKLSDEEISQIKKDWLLILETILFLKQNIDSVSLDYKSLPECLFLGQKLSNEFDYFVKLHGIPNKVITEKEFEIRKKERDDLYTKLHEVFDEINTEELISYIKVYLDDSFEKYKMYVENMENNTEKDVIEMMEIRNRIEYLYEEMELWLGKWRGGTEASKMDIREHPYQDVLNYDHALEEYINKKGKGNFRYLIKEARKRLVPEPDGSERFDFWWWHIATLSSNKNSKSSKKE